MNAFKTIIASALTGLAAIGVASASLATPTVRGNVKEGSIEAHVLLVEAIRRNGVKVTINDEYCFHNESVMGFYSGKRRILVVCQDNAGANGQVVDWTANDLDTLRHEAQHMIQDCRVGTNHDHELAPVYNSPTALAQTELGPERVARITEAYRKRGATDLVLLLEYEAFAVAAMNVPAEQVGDIQTYCGSK